MVVAFPFGPVPVAGDDEAIPEILLDQSRVEVASSLVLLVQMGSR